MGVSCVQLQNKGSHFNLCSEHEAVSLFVKVEDIISDFLQAEFVAFNNFGFCSLKDHESVRII